MHDQKATSPSVKILQWANIYFFLVMSSKYVWDPFLHRLFVLLSLPPVIRTTAPAAFNTPDNWAREGDRAPLICLWEMLVALKVENRESFRQSPVKKFGKCRRWKSESWSWAAERDRCLGRAGVFGVQEGDSGGILRVMIRTRRKGQTSCLKFLHDRADWGPAAWSARRGTHTDCTASGDTSVPNLHVSLTEMLLVAFYN